MNHSTENNNNFIYTPKFLNEFIARIHSLLRQTATPVAVAIAVADEPFQLICNGKFCHCANLWHEVRVYIYLICVYTLWIFGGVIKRVWMIFQSYIAQKHMSVR